MKYCEGCYLAFLLSEAARNELIKQFPPAFERVICHHVTIAFKLNQPLLEAVLDVIGETPTVVVTGYIKSDHLDCFTVEINGAHKLNINEQHYHVTHSLEAPAKPVDSNKVIRANVTQAQSHKIKIVLSGKLTLLKK